MNLNELKQLIHNVVSETIAEVDDGDSGPNKQGPGRVQIGKAYRLKEEIMQAVQEGIKANSDLIESQDEYERIVDGEIQKIKEDLDLTLSMVGRALYQVPFQAFKTSKKK